MIRTLSLLLGGILFTSVGIVFCRYYQWKRVGPYIPVTIGLFLIYIVTIGPLSQSQRKIEAITQLDPHEVVSISLEPSKNPAYKNINLFKSNRMISDSLTLFRVSRLLQKSVTIGEQYLKNPAQTGRIKIILRHQPPIILGFNKVKNATCLIANSNGEYGWSYGHLDAPGLGPVLDSIASTVP